MKLMFGNMIRDWFSQTEADYNDFVRALLLGDVKAMNAYMNRVSLGIFSYFDTGNRPSGEEPENPNTDEAILLEFKVHDAQDEESLEDTVKSALEQIEKRQYAVQLMAKGVKKERIRSYGFAFEGKKVLIGTLLH